MLQELPLQQLARQQFSITLNDVRWDIRLIEVSNGLMAADFVVADVPILRGVRCMPGGQPLLPYRYMAYTHGGNFVFSSADGNTKYPWWEDFGVTCRLYYGDRSDFNVR